MKTPTLAPVYLDNEPVGLKGEPKPRVSQVVAASGQRADDCEVKLLRYQADTQGKSLGLDAVIDRTEEPTKVIYLTYTDKKTPLPAAAASPASPSGTSKQTYVERTRHPQPNATEHAAKAQEPKATHPTANPTPAEHEPSADAKAMGKPGQPAHPADGGHGDEWPEQGKHGSRAPASRGDAKKAEPSNKEE